MEPWEVWQGPWTLTAAGTTFLPQHSLMFLSWGPLGSSTKGWEGVCSGTRPVLLPVELGEARHSIHTWGVGAATSRNAPGPLLESCLAESTKAEICLGHGIPVSPRGTPDWSPDTGQERPAAL